MMRARRPLADPDQFPLAIMLRAARLGACLSMRRAAKAASISQPYLGDLESGKALGASLVVLRRLARTLGIPLADLRAADLEQRIAHVNRVKATLEIELERVAAQRKSDADSAPTPPEVPALDGVA